jgi:ATP-binding cassette subfamily D (ALD) protein 3
VKLLLAILIPGVVCKETFWMSSIALLLIARSMCDLWMISTGTLIERVIIGKEPELFKKHLLEYVVVMPIVAVVNGLLRLNINRLKLMFRIRLSRHLHELYMRDNTFYKMTSIDSRVQNPDQILTQDVDKFCNGLVDLYSNISKPVLDIVIYIVKLTSNLGGKVSRYRTSSHKLSHS